MSSSAKRTKSPFRALCLWRMLLPMSLYAFSMTAALLPASQHTLRLTRIMMLSPCHVEYCERLASLPRPLPICSPGLHPCLILEANQQGLGHCHAYCHTDSALPSIHSVRLKQSQRMQSSRVRSIIRLLSVPGRTSSTNKLHILKNALHILPVKACCHGILQASVSPVATSLHQRGRQCSQACIAVFCYIKFVSVRVTSHYLGYFSPNIPCWAALHEAMKQYATL